MKILSFGLGVQSTALYYMSSTRFIDRVDYAIFADPGMESAGTYQNLELVKQWAKKNNGIPIIHCQGRNLKQDLLYKNYGRQAAIPAFTTNGKGQLPRQCTYEYKTSVVDKKIRELYNAKPYQRLPLTKVCIGFSTDEVSRCAPPRQKWKKLVYPLIDILYNRSDCRVWLGKNGFNIPPKSSCLFCPYQSNVRWLETKKSGEWSKVIEIDKEIRDLSHKGMKDNTYLHRQGVPLEVANLKENQIELWDNVCDGDCGT